MRYFTTSVSLCLLSPGSVNFSLLFLTFVKSRFIKMQFNYLIITSPICPLHSNLTLESFGEFLNSVVAHEWWFFVFFSFFLHNNVIFKNHLVK